jgi:hypothetical protein
MNNIENFENYRNFTQGNFLESLLELRVASKV